RLVALGGDAVALGAGFLIEERDVERDDAGLERLAVLARQFVVRRAEAAQLRVPVDPAEDRPETEALIRLQSEALPRPFALVVAQLLGEAKEPFGPGDHEHVRERRIVRPLALPIAEVAGAGQAVIRPGRHAALDDRARVGIDVRHGAGSSNSAK